MTEGCGIGHYGQVRGVWFPDTCPVTSLSLQTWPNLVQIYAKG